MTESQAKTGNGPFYNIAFNLAIPALILYKLSGENRLGPAWALVLALCFPVGYGAYDFWTNRKTNALSILGFVSFLLTGSFGLMKLDGIWFAVKEATIPTLMGVAVVVSLKTKYPLVKTLLYNDKLIDVEKVAQELKSRGTEPNFERLLKVTTWLLACSFALSAVLNFALAVYLLKSPAGTEEFNKELGKMTAMSYPVIVLPCMVVTMFALWRLLSGIRKLTGLDLDQVFKGKDAKTGASAP